MKDLEYYIEEERLEEVSKDKGKAKGLMKRSKRRLENEKDKEITETNAFQVLENIYEAMREIMAAWMALKGYKADDHVAVIAWSAEHLDLDKATVNKLHKFRKLRNASRYEAEEITTAQASEAVTFAESFIEKYGDQLARKLE